MRDKWGFITALIADTALIEVFNLAAGPLAARIECRQYLQSGGDIGCPRAWNYICLVQRGNDRKPIGNDKTYFLKLRMTIGWYSY